MAGVGATIVTAAGMFAATNIDDAVVLALLNIAHRSAGTPTRSAIWAGQFLGIGLIVAVSLLAALGLQFLALRWVGLLGVIPLLRGIVLSVKAIRRREPDAQPPVLAGGVGSVTAVTFANGGDNIALYTSAFRVMTPGATAITLTVFAATTALWCAGAALAVSYPRLVASLDAAARWLIPAVLITLGSYIILRSGLLPVVE